MLQGHTIATIMRILVKVGDYLYIKNQSRNVISISSVDFNHCLKIKFTIPYF